MLVVFSIFGSWVHSRYYRTVFSTGGDYGLWGLNNRSAVAVGFWVGPSSYISSPEFRIDKRNPEYFSWDRWLELSHDDQRIGYTLYLPHYMLLASWALIFGMLMSLRWRRHQMIRRRLDDISVGVSVENTKSNQEAEQGVTPNA